MLKAPRFIFTLSEPEQRRAEQGPLRVSRSWAVQQTGYDPSRAYPNNPNYLDPQPYRPTQPHVLKGAARGSALGAVGGVITGNAGKGAAAGAAMGGLAGGFRRLDKKGNRQLTSSRTWRQPPPRNKRTTLARWLLAWKVEDIA